MKPAHVLLAGLLSIIWAGEAIADQGWYLSPGARFIVYDDDRNTNNDRGTGLQLGIGTSLNYRFNVELHLNADRAPISPGVHLQQQSMRVDTLYFLSRGGPWEPDTPALEPYLVAGIGYRSTEIGGADDRHGTVAEVGFGTFMRFTPRQSRARLRADVRYGREWLSSGNGQPSEEFDDISFNFGVVIPIGEDPGRYEAPERRQEETPGEPAHTGDCPPAPAGVPVDADGCEIPVVQRLREVRFESGTTRLQDGAHAELDRISDLLVDAARLAGLIAVHVAAGDDSASALRLSQRRAEVVRAQLMERGVAPERITARGYGERLPPTPGSGESGISRRDGVELHIIRW